MADAPDLGSGGRPCRFESCYPHCTARNRILVIQISCRFVYCTENTGTSVCRVFRYFLSTSTRVRGIKRGKLRNLIETSLSRITHRIQNHSSRLFSPYTKLRQHARTILRSSCRPSGHKKSRYCISDGRIPLP